MILDEAEPLEVSMLKEQLANLTCKCSVCEKSYISVSCREESKGSNKEIQAGSVLRLDQNLKYENAINPYFSSLCSKVSCPGCYIALNILKGREPKICKDEETETKLGVSCCDKASGKCVKFLERTTSMSNIPDKNSCTSQCEKVTSPMNTNTSTLNGIMKKRSNEHVTFSDYLDHDLAKREVQAFYGHCFCLQNFMDSIRPPITNS